jgi:hypothetical protein
MPTVPTARRSRFVAMAGKKDGHRVVGPSASIKEESMRPILIALLLLGAPAVAKDYRYAEPPPQEDWNSYWLDYKTDLSEAKRELRSDLRRAKKESDKREAWAEYRREVADAGRDYRKEMREKGYAAGTVTVTK